MKSALLRLRENLPALSSTEQTIAEYILDHPEGVISLSIHELAKATFTSASSIVRLCNHLGFEGFKDFRKALTYECAVRKQSEAAEQKEIDRSDRIEDIIEKVTYKNIISLENTKNLLEPEIVQTCVNLIRRSRNILLFGIGSSFCVAKDAHLKFLRLNKPCLINEDFHSQILQSRNALPEDLAIVFSYSGQTHEMIECMKTMKERHVPIVAITRCVASPVSELADYCLYTAANESIFRSGAMSSRVAQLNIIDILFTAFTNTTYEESLAQLSKTHIKK